MKNKTEKADVYLPYNKNDFSQFWFNTDTNRIETYKIIRPLTDKEKYDYTISEDYDEECYLIKNSDGEEYCVGDINILENNISNEEWYEGLINVIEKIRNNDDKIQEFVKLCRIKEWIKKHG